VGVIPFPSPPLRDDRIVLRPWREADVPAQLRIFGDPVFQRFSDWAPESGPDARRQLAADEAARRRGVQVQFAIVAPDDDALVLGGASLHDIDQGHRRASVGYWLAPEARGGGLASRAVRLIAGWAFEDLGLARLELTCGPDNHASQRVAERCGFVREGLLRSHVRFKGGRRDSVVFGLLAEHGR
jgi:RimJ/RimL family protein N-acetyltransferase